MKKLIALVLLSGCSFATKEDAGKLAQGVITVAQAHNKLVQCVTESKDIKLIKPCLEATPVPEGEK